MSQPFLGKFCLTMAAAAFLAAGTPAQAYDFTFDNPDLSAHLDTTLSVGALWRTSARDPKLAANGPYASLVSQGISSQVDKNDADNNFDPGKLASLVYKITPSLRVNWKETYGAIVSGTYFYDQRIMDGTRDQGFDPCTGTNGIDCPWYPDNSAGKNFSDATRRYGGHYGRMLDTYVWGNFNLGEMPLTVKAGRQVINWGESLFIIGGVNSANYYDRNALLLPGSEIREALLPLDSLYFNLGLTDSLTAEAFYQFNWKPNFDVPDGTYFATSDSFPGHGSDNVIIDGEAVTGLTTPSGTASEIFAAYNASQGRLAGINYARQQDQVALHRADDEDPKDSGQFGLALRYEAESLNSTNFSFYFTNTHSKFPITGARMGEANWLGTAQGLAECTANPACNAVMGSGPSGVGALNTAHMIDTTQYFLVYPEDVQMYGLSFNTSINKLALSGEIAYRPSRYIINEFPDNLIAEVAGAAQGLSNSPSSTAHLTDHCIRTKIGGSCIPGGLVDNSGSNYYFYDTVQSYSGSLVGIYTFGPTLGADNLIGVLEMGMEHLEGLNRDLHYASTASVMQLPGHTEGTILDPSEPWNTYLDPTSWGYRVAVQAEYNGLIPQTTFKPSVRIAHDVNGNSAIGGNFMEGRKAATLTLGFIVMSKLDVALSGTSFWGARYSNKLGDRDNVSLSMSYSF